MGQHSDTVSALKKNNFKCNNPCFCSSGPKRLGQPGTPGGQDLEAALRSLSARQQNHSSERPFFDVERERKLHTLASKCDEAECSSGFLTPNESLVSSPAASTGTNYSNGSSRHSCGSSGGSRSYLPDRLQIVKPLEGKSLNFTVLPCFYNYLLQSSLCSLSHVERKLKKCCWCC